MNFLCPFLRGTIRCIVGTVDAYELSTVEAHEAFFFGSEKYTGKKVLLY